MRHFSTCNNIKVLMILAFTISLFSCKKFIEVDAPTNRSTEASVFNSDLSATAVLTGIYSKISNNGLYGADLLTFSKLSGLSSDEFNLWSGASDYEVAYYHNDLRAIAGGANAGTSSGVEMWNICYTYLYSCNQAIEGISNSKGISPDVKNQLLGEAKFLRALFYFYLVNLYGDIPLVTGIDPEVNRKIARYPTSSVYDQIVSDLKEAQTLLNSSFLTSALKPAVNAERIRPTKWAATALLSRVYLFNNNFVGAEAEATAVINQSSLFDVASVELNKVFLKNSKEAIWQLQPVTEGWNTTDARIFNLAQSPEDFTIEKSVSLTTSLYNSFEPGDSRKDNWIGSYISVSDPDTYYYPFKYKAGENANIIASNPGAITEYQMMLRLGEQYLIRSEARAKQGNVTGAVSDLNVLRTRARAVATVAVPNPLPNLSTSLTDVQVLDAVAQERRVELFSEWGHRWLDIKRTGK